MKKNRLLILPFLVGLMLMVYSWYLSFPLSLNSISDSIFNHVSILFWLSLPLFLASMYLIAISFENKYWKWIMAVSFVITLYSIFYFYFTPSTSDAHFFRGLTENFIRTHNLDVDWSHFYYQWPSFFILGDITTSVSGIGLINYEFLLFTILGFLLSTALYVYVSKVYRRGAFLAVGAFFIILFPYLNYQAAPFTLALALLFLLFSLETQKRSIGVSVSILILYFSITITHSFVPLFFSIYLLIRSILSKSKQYFGFFILSLIAYFLVQITLGQFSFSVDIIAALRAPSEYSTVIATLYTPLSGQVDAIAQLFSRTTTIAFAILCFAGFFFLVIKRKLRETDKAIFLTGIIYSFLGIVTFTLGSRALPLIFIPISLGISYLYESKLRPYLKYSVLILIILFVFVPIHRSFGNFPITFQTKEELATANFMIEKYHPNLHSIAISDSGMKWYLSPIIQENIEIDTDLAPRFGLSDLAAYECIIYSVGFAQNLQVNNISIEETSRGILDGFNVVYNSGFSYIAVKGK